MFRCCYIFLISVTFCTVLYAQNPNRGAVQKTDEPAKAPESKTPGWIFNRPEMDDPSKQFKYAQERLNAGETTDARREFDALVHEWGNSPEAPAAQRMVAILLDKECHYSDAFTEFQYLIYHYAGTFNYDEVLDKQLKIANFIKDERRLTFGIFPGFKSPENALSLYEQIVRNGPSWTNAPEAQFMTGMIHEELHEYEKAIVAYNTVQNRYPSSNLATESFFRRSCCLYLQAKDSSRDEIHIKKALSALSGYVARNPGKENAEEARKYISELQATLSEMAFEKALFYETKKHNLPAARIVYNDFIREFPASIKADEARKRIEMIDKALEDKNEK